MRADLAAHERLREQLRDRVRFVPQKPPARAMPKRKRGSWVLQIDGRNYRGVNHAAKCLKRSNTTIYN